MRPKIVRSKDEIVEAIDKSGGNIKEMVVLLGCGRDIVYKLLKENELRPYLEASRLDLVDRALETVKDNIDNIDTALRYLNYTKSLGSTNVQINGDGLVINVGKKEDKDKLDKFLDGE